MNNIYSALALTLLVSISGNFAFAKTAAKTSALNITGEDVAEYIYFSTVHKQSLKDLVEYSHMKAAQKKQALAFLKGHGLIDAKIPKMKYTANTSTVIFGEGNKVDYSLARKNQLVVNGQILAIPTDALFSDAVKKIQTALANHKSQAFSFPFNLISSAYATEGEAEATTVAAGFQSVQSACPPLEDQLSEPCPFKSDADYLKDRSLKMQGGDVEVLTVDLTCQDNKFISASTHIKGPGMPGMIEKVTLVYDKDGNESVLRNTVAGNRYCDVDLKNGGFDSIKYDGTGYDGCNYGSTDDGKIRAPGNGFQKGDKIQRLGGMNLPLRRLRSCCKSDECKTQMKTYIAESLVKTKGPKASGNSSTTPVQ